LTGKPAKTAQHQQRLQTISNKTVSEALRTKTVIRDVLRTYTQADLDYDVAQEYVTIT
jgi:hypothetical protein